MDKLVLPHRFFDLSAMVNQLRLGAWLRWGLSAMLNPMFPTLPFGTLAANIIGGYLVGIAVDTYLTMPPTT
jgi:CrcB protein